MSTEKRAKKAIKGRKVRAHARARERFIRRLAESGNVTDSARKARIAHRTVYELRKSDPEFAELWREAEEIAVDGLEGEARRRAVQGWDEPVYQQGRKVGVTRRYSDRMLEILLKGHRPKFRENQTVQVGVAVGDVSLPFDRDARMLEVGRTIGLALRLAGEVSDRQRQPQSRNLLTVERPAQPDGEFIPADTPEEAELQREQDAREGERLAEIEVARQIHDREGRPRVINSAGPWRNFRR